MAWLRKQRTQFKGGRRHSLKKEDRVRVWSLMKEFENKSMIAEMLGVSRRTVIRFLKDNPIPKSFVLEEKMTLEDFPEMQIWEKRQVGFAKQSTVKCYKLEQRKFFEWMKKYHSERARPCLWTSEDITEYLYGNEQLGWKGFEPYQWHSVIVPLRSLADKAPKEFPMIDLGLLPTKKTHRAKRSLAGKEEYYLEPEQIARMIEVAEERRDKALIAFVYNTAIRTTAARKSRIEDVHLDTHYATIIDKGSIVWQVYGLSDRTIQLIKEYLEERGYPKKGWLFTEGDRQIKSSEINKVIKKLGNKAGIEGKVLTAKVFRKSLVKNALTPVDKGGMGMNPVSLIGTGKQTKTCFCVGWTDMKVLMQHYAPQLLDQIEQDRQKFQF